jgi:catechol 2,3-dioxygenase-like lactoylglutathione lyase family enzyme
MGSASEVQMGDNATAIVRGGFGTWEERRAIVLIPQSVEAVGWLSRLFTGLAEGEGGESTLLDAQPEVELEDVDLFELRVSDFHPAMAVTAEGEGRFVWVCNRDDWATVSSLLEPFLVGRSGHQYLHHSYGATDEADVVLTFGEDLRDGERYSLVTSVEPLEVEIPIADIPVAEVPVAAPAEAEVPVDIPMAEPVEDEVPGAWPPEAEVPVDIPVVEPVAEEVPVAEVPVEEAAEAEVPEARAPTRPRRRRVAKARPRSMKLFRVTIPTSDVKGARKFYEHVLGLEADDTVPSRLYFHTGGAILVVVDWDVEGGDREFRANPDDAHLATDGLEETFARAVEAGAEIRSPIDRRPWGERSFYCSDLDGNPLCFVDETSVFMGRGAPWE